MADLEPEASAPFTVLAAPEEQAATAPMECYLPLPSPQATGPLPWALAGQEEQRPQPTDRATTEALEEPRIYIKAPHSWLPPRWAKAAGQTLHLGLAKGALPRELRLCQATAVPATAMQAFRLPPLGDPAAQRPGAAATPRQTQECQVQPGAVLTHPMPFLE